MEHSLAEKNVTLNRVSNMANVNSINLQGTRKDNIEIEVEGSVPEEDLDYVDDILDDGLSDFLEEELVVKGAKEKSTKQLPGATMHEKEAGGEIHMQQSSVVPGTSQVTKQSTDELTDEQLANLPRVRNLFNQFWAEKMQEMDKDKDKQVDKTGTGKNDNFIKSPSDTMIYVPALAKNKISGSRIQHVELPRQQAQDVPVEVTEVMHASPVVLNEMISNFVDSVRLEQQDLQEKERRKSSANQKDTGYKEAGSKTDRAVLEAEKFRASITAPNPGRCEQSQIVVNTAGIPDIGAGVSDDDFFHLTCHIDPSLLLKIEKGEFIELEKLLPRDKLGGKNDES